MVNESNIPVPLTKQAKWAARYATDRIAGHPRDRNFTESVRSVCAAITTSNLTTTAAAAREMDAAGGGGRWCVVTGGRGFAARHLVLMLLRSGEWRVRVADLPHAISLDRDEKEGILGSALREGQAVYTSVDLRDKAQVAKGV